MVKCFVRERALPLLIAQINHIGHGQRHQFLLDVLKHCVVFIRSNRLLGPQDSAPNHFVVKSASIGGSSRLRLLIAIEKRSAVRQALPEAGRNDDYVFRPPECGNGFGRPLEQAIRADESRRHNACDYALVFCEP